MRREKRGKFYARPHPQWQANADGTPVLIEGFLQAVVKDGRTVVDHYTLAIGSGKPETKLSSAPPIPWVGFKTKHEAQSFIDNYKLS